MESGFPGHRMLLGPLARQSFTLKSSNPGQPPLCPDPLGNRQTGRPSDPTRISLRPGMGPWEALLPGRSEPWRPPWEATGRQFIPGRRRRERTRRQGPRSGKAVISHATQTESLLILDSAVEAELARAHTHAHVRAHAHTCSHTLMPLGPLAVLNWYF